MPEDFATIPEPPYYAVIFTSRRRGSNDGYDAMASAMVLAENSGRRGLTSLPLENEKLGAMAGFSLLDVMILVTGVNYALSKP